MSSGDRHGVDAAEELDRSLQAPVDPSIGYDAVCPYVNAFVDREAYERWADVTEEAVTIGLTFEGGYALARAVAGTTIFDFDSI